MKTFPTWKMTYTIIDGGHECYDYLLREAERMTEAEAVAAVAEWWRGDGEPQEDELFHQLLLKEGRAALPGDGRIIAEVGWAAIPPITVTIHNGIVEDVTGLPDGATLQVRDLDDDDRDGQGRLVPWISIWEGPRQPRGQ